MKTLSRHMPKIPKGSLAGHVFAYTVIGAFVAAVAWLCFTSPVALALVSAIMLHLVVATFMENNRLRQIADKRLDDSICTFARAFDRRSVDPWTVRAAYEELQEYFGSARNNFPIRASDRFKEDLKMDGDDLCDLIFSIAERSKHDITFLDYGERIDTVGDLVACISELPKIPEAQNKP